MFLPGTANKLALLTSFLTPVAAQNHPTRENAPLLSCNRAPCVLPNTQASNDPRSVFPYQMAVNPSNPNQIMIGAWDCQTDGGVLSTSDAGKTWDDSCLPALPNTAYLYWTIVGYDLNNTAYAGAEAGFFGGGYGVQLSPSLDNGRTWSTPVSARSLNYGGWPLLAIDNNVSSAFRNSIYVSVSDNIGDILVIRSRDGGISWATTLVSKKIGPAVDGVFPTIGIGAKGEVYETWIVCKERDTDGEDFSCGGTVARVMFSKSLDGGNTFSPPIEIAYPRLAPAYEAVWGALPGTDIWVSEFPVVAVDTSNTATSGHIYVSFYSYVRGQMQVGVITSTDGGTNWSSPVKVSHSFQGDQFSQWVAVSSSGIVGVTWLDRRASYDDYQPYFSYSIDGGTSFIGERPLTSHLSFLQKDVGSNHERHLWNDFRMHAWAGNTLYATWMDTRTGSYQIELGGVQF